MRICMLANAQSVHTQRWSAAFAERGHEVHVLSIRRADIPGVEVHTVSALRDANDASTVPTLLSYLLLLIRARGLLKRLAPDIVNPHYAITHGVIAALAGAEPMVVTAWGSDVIWSGEGSMPRWRQALLRLAFHRARAVLVTSRFMEREVSTLAAGAAKVYRVPFGVDVARFTPNRDGRETATTRIGFVKAFETKYAPTDLIRAFRHVHSQEPKTELVMAGRGPDRADCQRLVDQLGLSEAVQLQGFIPNDQIPELLRSMDILVNCSIVDETFGVVVLEAAACGVPVVATNVGGVDETCVDGVNGILTPPGEVDLLADAILALVRDPERRGELGARGRHLAETKYRWSDSVSQALEIHQRIVEASRGNDVIS